MLARAAAIAASTLVSEDLTLVATGVLIGRGEVGVAWGLTACVVGIWLGDLGLWLAGRMGRRLPARLAGRVGAWSARLGPWIDRNLAHAILASRFLPGTRLPLYVATGMAGRRGGAFALWTLIAALVWTPLVVLAAAGPGTALLAPLAARPHAGWIAWLVPALALYAVLRGLLRLGRAPGRARLAAAIARLWRWEFWPAWLFYLPLVPWIAYLAARHGGLRTITAANPGIPDGGFVGESKADILRRLPASAVLAFHRLDAGPPAPARVAELLATVARRGWSFPLVLKPDAGQRGAGVRLVRDAHAARAYLEQEPRAVLAQVHHPGPFEAGIFYVRMPGEAHGRIFSITDKRFPEVTGDGVSTLARLVLADPRLRMQADVFLARHRARACCVLAAGERLRLAFAGNHCQGTMFRDGAHLLTPALERAVDALARDFNGFCFGRFDVRYADPAELRAGRGLAVVELNGATSESTNLYDPSWSLVRAYRTLFRQWALLFAVGAGNRARGAATTPLPALAAATLAYYRRRSPDLLAD